MSDQALTNIELVVIGLARADPVSSCVPRRSLVRRIFGGHVHQPLAAPRLEALRRYAILRRVHGAALAEAEHVKLRLAGFDDPQISEINRLVSEQDPAEAASHKCTPVPYEHSEVRNRAPDPAIASKAPIAGRITRAPVDILDPQEASKVMRYSSIKYASPLAPIALLVAVSSPTVVQAQDSYGSNVAREATSDNHITIGIGGAALPEFQGSKDYFIQPLPVVDIKQGHFFLRLGDGIGVNVVDTPEFQAGFSITPVRGYDADKVPKGVGKLGTSIGGRGFVSGTVGGFVGTLAVTAPFTGDAKGMFVDGEISYPVRVTDRLLVVPGVRATWADKKYLTSYFGVNAQQAAASGLPQYKPSSGLQDVGATLAVKYRLTDHISFVGSALMTRNLDRVMDSPFTERRWQPVGILGVAYTF
ncbi:MipA/OmpV family protein [Sphingomonas albertensis]|uniref:MipA/OmpV family protein n=1 Tax=Sphingomonas albertensis TaxID=2762591 RepID=A0ABR7AKX3_9SPHN|nr:MipA/OmpV family protein [Sphingomonas albertensis]MBC3941099.1 MipA/OmpV family protein [Sphingomonas albertensis]